MTKPTDMWEGFLEEIRKNLQEGKINTWANWGVVRNTMATDTKVLVKYAEAFEKNIKPLKDFDCIFEFGAGSGQFCKLIYQRGFKGHYTIFDFPELNEI